MAGSSERGSLLGGRYRLVDLIGAGAAGHVFEAVDERAELVVAVKLLRPELARNRAMAHRFRREARSLAALDHPHIVKVLDAGRSPDERPYLVMERLRGRSLAARLGAGRLAIADAVALVLQVLDAIGYAHRRGVLHRDIKPGNIMLVPGPDGGDFVKVCDFGMAKTFLDGHTPPPSASMPSTGLGAFCGTPTYMAPEQASGDPPDQRTDLYAIGVLLYELVTGEVPFRGASPMAILSRHLTQLPQPPSARRPDGAISRALEALILRALAKDRADRPPTASAFAEALERAQAAEPAAAVDLPPGEAPTLVPPDRAPRASSRGWPRGRALAVVSLPLLLMAGLGARWMRAPPPPTANALEMTAVAPAPVAAPDVNGGGVGAAPAQPPSPSAPPPSAARRTARRQRPRRPLPPEAPAPEGQGLQAVLRQAQQRLDEGKIAESCGVAEAARNQFEDQPALHRFLGRCLMRQGRLAEAQRHFRRYLELAPDAEDAPFIREILR
jgi:serine/threonine-protein kinase